MGLYRLGSGADLTRFCAARGGEFSVLGRQLHAVVADDHAVQVPLVLNVDNFAGMNIVGDEHAIEDGDRRPRRIPVHAVEADSAGVEQELDCRCLGRPERLAAKYVGRFPGLKRAEHGTDGRLAVAVRAHDEGVLGELGISGRGRATKAADVFNGNDFLQHLRPFDMPRRTARRAFVSLLRRDRRFKSFADEALIGHTASSGTRLHGVEQWCGHAHVHASILARKLEARGLELRQVVFGQVGGFDKTLGLFVTGEARNFLLHSA